jgi:hypothetical protein
MNGFITESVSKIYDGFGTAAFLLMLTFSTRLLYLPIEKSFGQAGVFIYILLLLAAGIFMLGKALVTDKDENRLAFNGLTAGVLLWQVTRFSNLIGDIGLFNQAGWLIWLTFLLIVVILWRRIFPVGLRFFSMTFLLLWAGLLYTNSGELILSWPAVLIVAYHSVKAAALIGILILTWWIAFRTFNPNQRKACAVLLAFCAMLAGMWF